MIFFLYYDEIQKVHYRSSICLKCWYQVLKINGGKVFIFFSLLKLDIKYDNVKLHVIIDSITGLAYFYQFNKMTSYPTRLFHKHRFHYHRHHGYHRGHHKLLLNNMVHTDRSSQTVEYHGYKVKHRTLLSTHRYRHM